MLTRAALRFFFTSSAPVLSKYGAIPPCSAAKSFSAFHWLELNDVRRENGLPPVPLTGFLPGVEMPRRQRYWSE